MDKQAHRNVALSSDVPATLSASSCPCPVQAGPCPWREELLWVLPCPFSAASLKAKAQAASGGPGAKLPVLPVLRGREPGIRG